MVRSSAVMIALWVLGAAAAIAQPTAPAPANARPAAAAVTVNGARIEVSPPLEFQLGKAALAAEARPVLDELAAAMRGGRVAGKVQIGVHTDSLGSDAANLKLSQDRADAVRAYLIGKGVPADRLEAKGFGETVPIASNATAQGRAQNRRVELVLVTAAAAAQPAPPAQPQAAAQDLFAKGEQAYQAGDFDLAVQYFLGAYAHMPSPALLYNVAQAYRMKGDRKQAIYYYEQYLTDAPKGPVAAQVRRQLAGLRKAP
jgi:outer membrane protein OmpA-like peptidoglycan-associated protein